HRQLLERARAHGGVSRPHLQHVRRATRLLLPPWRKPPARLPRPLNATPKPQPACSSCAVTPTESTAAVEVGTRWSRRRRAVLAEGHAVVCLHDEGGAPAAGRGRGTRQPH